jgi:hypothetical protein
MSSSVMASSMTAVDLGVAFAPDRAAHNLAVYRTIAEEIARLREIDFSAKHPAVIFDPIRAYASWPCLPGADTSTAAAHRGIGSESGGDSGGQLRRESER